MKKIILIAVLVLSTSAAYAQWFDFSSNNGRVEAGLSLGQVGTGTKNEGIGSGANALIYGGYIDLVKFGPEHRFDHRVKDTDWEDHVAICVHLGYQIPILPWLRVMPLVGYAQTNEGLTRGDEMYLDTDDSPSWYHPYDVTKGSRTHYFNYGGGISVQPIKWFSINFCYTPFAIYGGIGINLAAFANK